VNTLSKTLSDLKQLLKPTSNVKVGDVKSPSKLSSSLKDFQIPDAAIDSYDDLYGESVSETQQTSLPTTALPKEDNATTYFSLVTRKPSIRGKRLSLIGRNVKLAYNDTDDR
jgi:hypothetical protein